MEDDRSPYKLYPANVLSPLQLEQNATVLQGVTLA